MSYMPAQALLKTLLLTCPAFGGEDVTEGDLRILDRGKSSFCVLFPGGVPAYDTAQMVREHEWECLVDLFAKFDNDTSYNTFGTLRDTVITLLDTAKYLGTTYHISQIASEGDPAEVYDKSGGGPFFIMQRLRVAIIEEV